MVPLIDMSYFEFEHVKWVLNGRGEDSGWFVEAYRAEGGSLHLEQVGQSLKRADGMCWR